MKKSHTKKGCEQYEDRARRGEASFIAQKRGGSGRKRGGMREKRKKGPRRAHPTEGTTLNALKVRDRKEGKRGESVTERVELRARKGRGTFDRKEERAVRRRKNRTGEGKGQKRSHQQAGEKMG